MTLRETYTPAEVGAALKKKSADWVERRVNAGEFAHLRVGQSMRFTEAQAEAFIAAFVVEGDGTTETGSDPLRSQSPRSRNRKPAA